MAFLLVLASTAGQLTVHLTGHDYVYGLIALFNVDAEQNIPTFFSSCLLLFAALLLAIITVQERRRMVRHASRWMILSWGFLFMSADEAVSLHEKLIKPMRKLVGGHGNLGVFYFAWVIPGIVLLLFLVPFFLRFLLWLPVKARVTFLVAAALYLGGSIGFELIGGRYAELHGMANLTYNMLATVEESLEMAGTIVFIGGLLAYLADNYEEVRFCVDAAPGGATRDRT